MTQYLDQHPDVAAVSPKILRPDGRSTWRRDAPSRRPRGAAPAQLLSRLFPRSRRLARYNRPIARRTSPGDRRRHRRLPAVPARRPRPGRRLHDAFFMYVRTWTSAFGSRSRWKIMYWPASVVVHYKDAAAAALERNDSGVPPVDVDFFRKHYARTTPAPIAALIYAGIEVRSTGLLLANASAATNREPVAGVLARSSSSTTTAAAFLEDCLRAVLDKSLASHSR